MEDNNRTIAIKGELYDRLTSLARAKGIPLESVVEECLKDYLKKLNHPL